MDEAREHWIIGRALYDRRPLVTVRAEVPRPRLLHPDQRLPPVLCC